MASSRSRISSASKRNFSPKMSASGVKVMAVPVPRAGPVDLSEEVGLPRENVWTHRFDSRLTSASSLLLSAFTTELPTPCRPPECR